MLSQWAVKTKITNQPTKQVIGNFTLHDAFAVKYGNSMVASTKIISVKFELYWLVGWLFWAQRPFEERYWSDGF